MDRSMRPLTCTQIYIYIEDRQGKGTPGRLAQGLGQRGSCFILEQPGLSIAEVWPSNVIWGSSAWHICFHSKRSCSPRAGSRGREAALKLCLHLSGAKSHKGEKFLEILNWRWHGGFGLFFSLKQNQKMGFAARFKSILYHTPVSYEILPSFINCSPDVSTFFLPWVYVDFLTYCVEKEETLDRLGDEVWPEISELQKRMRKENLNLSPLQGKAISCLIWTERFHVSFFFFLQCWVEVHSSLKILCPDLLVKICVAAFSWTLTVCTSTTYISSQDNWLPEPG